MVRDEYRRVRISRDGKRILRRQARQDYHKQRKEDNLVDISWKIDFLADENEDWKRPKIRLVKNTKALRKKVEKSA